MTPAPWHTVLALALVGERFDLGLQDRPDVARLLADLDSRGFGRRRVEQIARGTSPWPFPLLPADREGLGGAQFFAALREAGVERIHNNLESSEKFFPNICTTHSWRGCYG